MISHTRHHHHPDPLRGLLTPQTRPGTQQERSSDVSDGERDPSPSAQETPAVRVQPDQHAKTKEPGFRYTA
ncbi:unnamed protein product [Spirodela intermedia]|uniref:Uncharacterized protein n=1 Tax=Spirodela intermedia TaxID=51605 RepID=A0ABN7E9F2_SPIIN|nr:unnamed protein product [Spirodela intermedia]